MTVPLVRERRYLQRIASTTWEITMSQLENCPHCGKKLSADLKPKDRELLRLLLYSIQYEHITPAEDYACASASGQGRMKDPFLGGTEVFGSVSPISSLVFR